MTTMHSVNIDARKFSPSWWAIKFIRLYQLTLSLWLGRQCRFLPTCSHYAQQAIAIHGIWRGTWLGLKRIGRCHPFHDGGLDPVPAPSPDSGSM